LGPASFSSRLSVGWLARSSAGEWVAGHSNVLRTGSRTQRVVAFIAVLVAEARSRRRGCRSSSTSGVLERTADSRGSGERPPPASPTGQAAGPPGAARVRRRSEEIGSAIEGSLATFRAPQERKNRSGAACHALGTTEDVPKFPRGRFLAGTDRSPPSRARGPPPLLGAARRKMKTADRRRTDAACASDQAADEPRKHRPTNPSPSAATAP